MTQAAIRPRVPSAELVPLRVVDSDVHPVPRPGQLVEYLPEPRRFEGTGGSAGGGSARG